MSENNQNQELLANVLAVTRDQLARSMNLTAELEALLNIERKKNEELQKALEKFESAKK